MSLIVATFSPNVPASILPGQLSPADPQCISCQDPSQFAKSRDYQGSDLIKGGLSASSPAECCKKCTGTRLCQYWTYGTANPGKGLCWLKSSMRGNEQQENRESGRVCAATSVPTSVSNTSSSASSTTAAPSSSPWVSSAQTGKKCASTSWTGDKGLGVDGCKTKCQGYQYMVYAARGDKNCGCANSCTVVSASASDLYSRV